MNHRPEKRTHRHLPLRTLALAVGLTLPVPLLAATIALATSPLATSTTSTVNPNLLMVVDNSGSMDWDHMPDDATDGGSAVSFSYGYYGVRSSQCNMVYYDPTFTYLPPALPNVITLSGGNTTSGSNIITFTSTAATLKVGQVVDGAGIPAGAYITAVSGTTQVTLSANATASGSGLLFTIDSYPNSSFTSAWDNGFNTSSTQDNLNSAFQANQSGLGGNAGGADSATMAYYYSYSGSQTTAAQKNYNSTTNTFYNECHSARYASPGRDVFTKIVLSSSASSTTATITANCSSCTSTTVSQITVNGNKIMSGSATASTSTTTVASSIATQINLCTSAKVGSCSAAHGYTATASSGTVTITGLASTASSLIVTQDAGTMTFDRSITLTASPAQLTNFANWYSYYRIRMLMMKTASGRAFMNIGSNYRVGLMKISQSTPVINVTTFCDNGVNSCVSSGANRTNWYNGLYNLAASGSTPLRTALSNAGIYFAGKLGGTDPMQYSCQQNFAILSTDGYWNTGDGYKLDGSTIMDNEDGPPSVAPYYDGSILVNTWTNQYTRHKYSSSSSGCGSGRKVLDQLQTGSCQVTTSTASCTPGTWSNSGSATVYAACSTSYVVPATTTPVLVSTTQNISGGSSNSLADVAAYYYNTDLRDSTLSNCTGALGSDVCNNNVFTTSTDNKITQHMTTFTLGLGASGWMQYSPTYQSDTTGSTTPPCDSAPDYVAVKLGCPAKVTPSVCSWQASTAPGSTCVWPVPGMDGSGNGFIANIDDLWHAAVNGHGAYFSATNPATLSQGLSSALYSINSKRGSAAAAATSTLNPVAGNNYAYVASYTTVDWTGNLEARGINVDNGQVSTNATWCVENVAADTCPAPGTIAADTSGATTAYNCVTPNSNATTCSNNGGTMIGSDCYVPVATACTGTMNGLVSDTSDTRTIKTANSTGTALIDFTYANLTTAQQAYFGATQIASLSQWSTLSPAQQATASSTNLFNYMRGQHGYEQGRTTNPAANQIYRQRKAVLGDAIESQPTYLSNPVFSYPYPGYSNFKTTYVNRAGTVYMGTNDGMMHAFDASTCPTTGSCTPGTGIERWAYVPSMVIPNMWHLADVSYGSNHINFVNGSPITTDVCTANCTDATNAVWKTILVAGLDAGGRGYYALDITNPSAPSLLWEFTTTAGIGSTKDDDLGYSYGEPVVTTKADGTWVVLVTSGYNNTSPGTGKGFLYVLNAGTGAIISKIGTGVGSTTTPSGLAKIAGWNNEVSGNKVGYVYGGDLQGNIWRFDINDTATSAAVGTGSVLKFATLFSDTAGTLPQPITTTPVLGQINGKRYVFISTGKYLELGDLSTTPTPQTQSMYSIRDNDATATLVNPRNSLPKTGLIANPDGTATRITDPANTPVTPGGAGCYLDYPDTGERANIDSKLVQGILIAPTIVPSNTACSPGGFSWLNYIDYATCGAVSVKSDSTIVGINIIYVQGIPQIEIVTSTNPTPEKPGMQPTFPPPPPAFSGKRTIWRELF